MVIEETPIPYLEWLLPSPGNVGALVGFVSLALAISVLAWFICFLVAVVRTDGPGEAFFSVASGIKKCLTDIVQTSPRRVSAMAWLAVQESLRRRILVGVALFICVILFAGWFLDVKSDHPARLFLSVVMGFTQFIVLILSIFISTFSLPSDIKNRTIYTVVTKPVRSMDIVLGRIVGFVLVGTALLALMCLTSYVFLVRGLRHTHVVSRDALIEETDDQGDSVRRGRTGHSAHHRHELTLDSSGRGRTDHIMDHHHEIVVEDTEGDPRTGTAVGALQARVPVYGTLRFLDRFGQPGKGTNVGYEWGYRGYIEGRTRAAAIWTFEGIREADFPEGLPIEMILSVFRTHKGDMSRTIPGKLEIRNPNPRAPVRRSVPIDFQSREFETLSLFVNRRLDAVDENGLVMDQKTDLFRDFVDDGRVEIWITCNEPQQFFGMARADLYLRQADRSFLVNFIKSYVMIWFQMVIVICFGVAFSTFLNGPVAMLATLANIIGGLNNSFMQGVATGEVMGGGPIESLYRIITQNNVMVDLEPGPGTTIMKGIDSVFNFLTYRLSWLLPDFRDFDASEWVASGFDISTNMLATQGTITFAFFVVLAVVGCFFLKTREIAA